MSPLKFVWNTLLRFFAISTVSMVALAGLALPAAASSSQVASGTFAFAVVSQTVRTRGQDLIITEHAQVIYSGGLTGTADDYETIVVRPDGSFVGFGTEDCTTCTFRSKTGSYFAVFGFNGNGIPFSGAIHFVSGAGGLAGVHGGGHFQGDAAGNQTYSYTLSFDPEQ